MKLDRTRAFAPPDLLDGRGQPHPAVAAIKAMARGEATGEARPDQQKTAIDFIVNELARTNDEPYRPDGLGGDRDTAFACGRAFVGRQIRRIVLSTIEELTGKSPVDRENP